MPINWNPRQEDILICKRGTSCWYSFIFYQGDGVTPVDLTGAIIELQIRQGDVNGLPSPTGQLMMDLTIGSGLTVPLPPNGTVNVNWTIAQADSMQADDSINYYWDMKITFPDGTVDRRPKDGPPGIVSVFEKITP